MNVLTGVNGVANFRDLGGLPLRSGGVTNTGVVYRSAALNTVTEKGLGELAASNVASVADLRATDEVRMAPDRLPTGTGIDYVELPITPGNLTPTRMETMLSGTSDIAAALEANIPSLGDLYESMLEGYAPHFAAVARLASGGATLVHCTAGKDRTGVACALILDAVGVQRDAIVQDYAQSQKALAGTWAENAKAQLQKAGLPLVPALVEVATTTPPAAIEQAFTWICSHFKSSAHYLRHGGLLQEELEQLQVRFGA
ncbi:tyrosine-protein phosphatase [Actinomycetaceae bacterium WB03_NA08]|uniref:Tyrosine-protein phosphatase n=1 Tax=Scrofimicrobium canadense TaxID=2652290 RepID=A0A6N7W6J8_9ACTO|nr:tyrosine-protein phosphatase [Scrofimicrobium canadense]MSS84113.1 tyrosine-protein phosphatase [Scrofimicrobium canadense]